ncbi:MAG: iron ABC transporter permease [Bacteroidales bacterium]|nr:iron ABC transporter permease [Bacteroidales bacterium]
MFRNYYKWGGFLIILLLLVLLATTLSVTIGEFKIRLFDIPGIIRNRAGIEYDILTKIRLPRIVLAFAVGGALSVTGAILQGIYRNPLVEPYTLGISGGAALGVALMIVFGVYLERGAMMLPAGGFAGSLLAVILVYALSFRRGSININRMLLIGVMVSFVASASMMFLMATTTSENIHSIVFWIMGSLDEPNSDLIRFTLVASLIGLLLSLLYTRSLNALRLGEQKARHLGVNSNVAVRILFIIASLLTGICVSVAGVIGFVGLIIPHIIRLLMGSDYRFLLLGSFLGGGFFLIICDILARTIIAPNELPIGVITGLLGGTVFIIMLSRTKVSGI